MKKFLDQDFSGAALAEFKREVSKKLLIGVDLILILITKNIKKIYGI